MAIQFPIVGSFVTGTFSASSVDNICNGLNNALVAAGWTSVKLFGISKITLVQPSNGDTIQIGGSTYTYKTAINNANPREITIGANSSATAQNTADAVVAVTGGGTEWSTATTANTVCSATNVANVITFLALAGGTDANSLFSTFGFGSLASARWSQGRGFMLTNLATPQGMQGSLWIVDLRGQLEDRVAVWWGTPDGGIQSLAYTVDPSASTAPTTGLSANLLVSGGRNLTYNCNAHQFFVWLSGDKATRGCQVGMSSPYLRAGQLPLGVNGVANNGTGEFRIQTVTPHGLATGNIVFLSTILGTTGANGTWAITVIDATHYDLDTSTFGGVYGGGGLQGGSGVSGPGGLSQCLLGWGDNDNSSYQNTWRNTLGLSSGFVIANNNSYTFNGGSRVPEAVFSRRRTGGLFYGWGLLSNTQEARVGWPGTSALAQFQDMGQLWSAFLENDSLPMDTLNSGYLGHNWINQTDFDGEGALWIATS